MFKAINNFFTIGLVSSLLVSLHLIYSIYFETLADYLYLGDHLGLIRFEARYEKIVFIALFMVVAVFLIFGINKKK